MRENTDQKTPNADTFHKVPFPGLIHSLATESPLKFMKKAFYFTLKALFVLGY